MTYEDHIKIDKDIEQGHPCIKGTKIRVSKVLELLAAGEDIYVIESIYAVSKEDVRMCIGFAGEMLTTTYDILYHRDPEEFAQQMTDIQQEFKAI